jgi:hypothetical protein
MIFPVKKEVESNDDGNQNSNYESNQVLEAYKFNWLLILIIKGNGFLLTFFGMLFPGDLQLNRVSASRESTAMA